MMRSEAITATTAASKINRPTSTTATPWAACKLVAIALSLSLFFYGDLFFLYGMTLLFDGKNIIYCYID
jgi:hypothetical protein